MTTVVIIDAITGDVVAREQTNAEKAQATADIAEAVARAQTETNKAAAKQLVLTKLGLTADEVTALLS